MEEPSTPGHFDVGDRVRIDIPDETRRDHKHHGRNGKIIAVVPVGGDAAAGRYRVKLDVGGAVDVGPGDLRPPI